VTKHLQTIALVFAFALASSVIVRTQEKPAPPAPKPAPAAATPLKVSVVVSRFQGEKKLSSLPYTLSVNAGSRGTLRMGAKVPVMMITANAVERADGGPFNIRMSAPASAATSRSSGRRAFGLITMTTRRCAVRAESHGNKPPPGNPSFRSFPRQRLDGCATGRRAFTTATDGQRRS
jgi:hypothetical protein